jgi:hypothetical protein
MAHARRRRSPGSRNRKARLSSGSRNETRSVCGAVERLEPRHLMAVLYWDPDRIATNNVVDTGAGLGGSQGNRIF